MATVSIRDVAALAGVSVGTVSNVLNRPTKVSESTVAKVQRAIDILGFVRNDAARQLRAGRSRSIGLVVLDVANPFFTSIARGAEEAAEAAGLSVLLGNSDDDASREASYLDLFEEQRVHGVLISPIGEGLERLERLRARGIPAVLVDRPTDDPRFDSVAVDDVAGGRLAVEHLLSLGRRRILMVAGPVGIRQVRDRLAGARTAVDRTPGASLEVVSTSALTVLEGRAVGGAVAARDAADRPDAIFAANDLLAVGVLQAFAFGSSIRVPDDIALVGYDDIDFASAAVVPLTSVRQPSALIGRTGVELLLRQSDDGDSPREHVVFQPELVIRDSTGTAGERVS
jgi:LacI family transcriptional regulator